MSLVRFQVRPPFSIAVAIKTEVTILDTNTIQHCIETLCSDGCCNVNDYIARLETGEALPQTTHLNLAERQEVLKELKAIMAVYKTKS